MIHSKNFRVDRNNRTQSAVSNVHTVSQVIVLTTLKILILYFKKKHVSIAFVLHKIIAKSNNKSINVTYFNIY